MKLNSFTLTNVCCFRFFFFLNSVNAIHLTHPSVQEKFSPYQLECTILRVSSIYTGWHEAQNTQIPIMHFAVSQGTISETVQSFKKKVKALSGVYFIFETHFLHTCKKKKQTFYTYLKKYLTKLHVTKFKTTNSSISERHRVCSFIFLSLFM